MKRRASGRVAVAVLATLAVAAACGGDDDEPTPAPSSTSSTQPEASSSTTVGGGDGALDAVALSTTGIAEVASPTALAARQSSPDLYVAEQSGRVRVIEVTAGTGTGPPRYRLASTPVLDLTEEVVDGGEQGLLGLAFSSDGRKLYVNFTAEPDGRTVVLEYEMSGSSVDRSSRRQLLEIEQPYRNHNGGNLVTGPDGYLYVGLGDGGDGGDPEGNGQDPTTLLGSILRIDAEAGNSSQAYGIPAGNPFDDDSAAPETWLYGVRNPWRFSFDRATGDLWVADVGQDEWEEVNLLPARNGFDAGRGANLGWNQMEGSHPFDGGENPAGGVLPVFEYSTDEGCSVTGGYVYRGDAIPSLQGTYLFADYCAPGVRGIQIADGAVVDERTWDLPTEQVQSFGQDNDGELYVLLAGGPILKLVVPGAGD